jgi:6-phospho-beta-glucosidase
MKLTVLGGGGFRVPLVYEAATSPSSPVSIDELAFYDTSIDRMDAVKAVIAGMPQPAATRLTFTDSLDDAVRGADFVFCSIRVGGLDGRVADETVALDLGVLGQETTGPGGLAYALRTVPVMRSIAEKVRDLAPGAYFINFTNPAGIVTESLRPLLGDHVVGICDTPIGLLRRIQRISGSPAASFDYVGLNHLGWLRSVTTGSGDILPAVMADDAALGQLEEARLMGFDWVRQLGAIPNEYLYYYYYTREAIARIRQGGATRGELVADQQRDFYRSANDHPETATRAWRRATEEREATYMAEARPVGKESDRMMEDLGGGYQQVAMDIMAALALDKPATFILNISNGSGASKVVGPLPDDCVVEVPCTVDSSGLHALPIGPVTGHQEGLLTSVKAVEQLTIQAAVEGRAELAWRAMALHPLVDSVAIARDLLTGYQAAHKELAYLR